MLNNSYWNGNGKYQKIVDQQLNNIDNLKISKTLKDKYLKVSHSYYRYYNDGDVPRYKEFKNAANNEIPYILETKIDNIIKEIIKAIE